MVCDERKETGLSIEVGVDNQPMEGEAAEAISTPEASSERQSVQAQEGRASVIGKEKACKGCQVFVGEAVEGVNQKVGGKPAMKAKWDVDEGEREVGGREEQGQGEGEQVQQSQLMGLRVRGV